MRRFIFISLVLLGATSATAQSDQYYRTAVGVKFYPGSVTVKHFIRDDRAIEALGYFWNYGMRVTALYEFHKDIPSVDGLRWYVGPGAHIGFYNKSKVLANYGGVGIGVDGMLGLDYKINNVPLNLSVDWQPSFEFGNNYGNGFSGGWGGLGIRYTF
ncbi:MAG TPA: hypothetical protein PKK69_02760 [Ferruginibacter sp.]|nr:hypothetical protein [Ferruginibacter sp.]